VSILIAKHWWSVLLRGVVGIAVGIALLAWTVPTLKVLFWLVAIFAILDGLIMVISGIAAKEAPGAARGALVIAGLVGIGFGRGVDAQHRRQAHDRQQRLAQPQQLYVHLLQSRERRRS
jgi:uncharacterized membrane protein HdeD (DUF308 family)